MKWKHYLKIIISNSFNEIFTENWNKKWESNFEPIQINRDCVIRASFHKQINQI